MPTGHYVPLDHQNAMIAAYQGGATAEEAAAPFGYSESGCLRALKRNGVAARDISKCQRVYAVNEDFFESIDTEEKAYWLGFITADGCVASATNTIDINLATRDRKHLEKFNLSILSHLPILDYAANKRSISRATVNSKKMKADLVRLGVTPKKSHTVEPWEGSAGPLAAHYWRGAFDGDGAIMKLMVRMRWRDRDYGIKEKWHIEFVGNRFIVTGFANFIRARIGIGNKVTPMSSIFRVRYGGTGLPRRVAGVLYEGATIYLDRKKALADELAAIVLGSKCRKGLGAADVLSLRERHGSWGAAGRSIGMTSGNFSALRRRLGLSVGQAV